MLLALTGGSLDALLYLNHGKVFAGAMTGNAVLCGIALLDHNHLQALHHMLPIVAFVVGVLIAQALQHRLKRHAVRVALCAEITGLLLASFLPGSFPDMLFVAGVSLLAAVQASSYKKVDTYSYNSTFITGDLRMALEALYSSLHPGTRREGLQKFRDLGAVILAFLCGAVAGAFFAPRAGNHTLWLPAAALAVVLGLVLHRGRV